MNRHGVRDCVGSGGLKNSDEGLDRRAGRGAGCYLGAKNASLGVKNAKLEPKTASLASKTSDKMITR